MVWIKTKTAEPTSFRQLAAAGFKLQILVDDWPASGSALVRALRRSFFNALWFGVISRVVPVAKFSATRDEIGRAILTVEGYELSLLGVT